MDNLIIIGNGFDLAHGLKTSYRNFFEYIIEQILNEPKEYFDLITVNKFTKSTKDFLKFYSKHKYSNKFFHLLTKDFADKNWCDIEALYFEKVIFLDKANSPFKDIHDLNKQFSRIKDLLEDYLLTLKFPNLSHDYFERLFSYKTDSNSLILNFNYTQTFINYLHKANKILNIHGELGNQDNPIIFGYAAKEDQIQKLRIKDNEYMRNIKRTNYNFTGSYKFLLNFLKTAQHKIKVVIMGHSCGESDQLILSEIFNHPNVELIEIIYHRKEGYFQQFVNIQKLIQDEKDYNKIIEFDISIRMPQENEDSDYEELLNRH